ncbi:PAS domain S-box-containing protein [Halopelagius inordinatus]|uniref:histidine kinase n=1 Tax=Halopelagius inordinatus TaxID=553467 RepID=A0A1I2NNP7_9EURY|nr:PAS domain S-box protein [Halopelagius inordinatus]SFG05193.1 PAS domain S-box-containing protein [Halopelagius inordinatus]
MGHSNDLPPSDGASDATQHIASLLTRASIGVVHLAPDGAIATVNEPFTELTGWSRETLLGNSFADVLVTAPRSLRSLLTEAPTDGRSTTLTLPFETADGDVVACEVHFETVVDGDDYAFVGVCYRQPNRDAEADLSERDDLQPVETDPSAKAFVALADAIPDGIILLDSDSEIQYANPAVERILGYPASELVGGSKLSIIPERLRDAHLSALNRYLETGVRNIDWEYVELPAHHKEGHEVPLGISFNDFRYNGERYFVGLFRDISPRKEAKRALEEREKRLRQYKEYTSNLLNAIDDVFYVIDSGGNLQRWNRSLREVTGYERDEIESMQTLEFFDEDARVTIADAMAECFERGSVRVEANILTKRDERIPYEFVATRLDDPDGNPVVVGLGRDISERKEIQRRLEASNDRLEQFAYAASHDLKEPLRMVTSYLQLVEKRYADALDEDGEEFIEYAVDGAERMREMIDGLLQYSRVETQGDPFEPTELDAVLDDVLTDMQMRVEESDAVVERENLPRVLGDEGQLRQVFQNLLSNAINYSGDEPPHIDVSAERAGDVWRLSVRDEGIGIDSEDQERIFRVFERLHTRDEHPGTGLGLTLCQRIVERHGGDIWVDSTPGEGTTFSFTLPVADARDE